MSRPATQGTARRAARGDHRRSRIASLIFATAVLGPSCVVVAGDGQTKVPTSSADFFQPGTQPDPTGLLLEPFETSTSCSSCHGNYFDLDEVDDENEPYDAWVTSMMAQAARDPVWQAALAIANQDANLAGETCIRCHAPTAWLQGRSSSGTLDEFSSIEGDFDGVNCHFCHRSLKWTLEDDSPIEDAPILAALDKQGLGFTQPGQGRFVIDPDDVRRGPFEDIDFNMHEPAPIIPSPFHRSSEVCASCHDVSIPTYSKQPDGTYALNELGEPHPSQNPYEMFPEQRTYSEWLHSDYANGGVVYPDGRFGGNLTSMLPNTVPVSSCQDCHMPDVDAGGCAFWNTKGFPFFARPDLPKHTIVGANTWVRRAILEQYGFESGLTEDNVALAEQWTLDMLR
ncbi:MAG: multiheme c-type cytochrome, partial [Planctomycetota bacterium]